MKIVVFTGAGISRESGIATFRDSDGLWADYRIEDVCTPEALVRNREGVIDFYNMRRREVLSKEPNAAHRALVELERHFDVEIFTQNIDDLHERREYAGHPPARRGAQAAQFPRRAGDRPHRGLGAEVRHPPSRRFAAAAIRGFLRRERPDARPRRGNRPNRRHDDCRRHIASGLSGGLARALSASRRACFRAVSSAPIRSANAPSSSAFCSR